MDYIVTASQGGNSVLYVVTATDIKNALDVAKDEANRIFSWKLGDETPKVKVKPAPEEK